MLQKVRQDWAKETLYNISRATTPPAANKTFFQQKWLAKSMARAYHNPHVREGTWTRMFDRRLPAVVPMNHQYLAQFDGSEMGAGRGSGVDKQPPMSLLESRDGNDRERKEKKVDKTPYMHMTFYPLERRLDTAIWRALFASSTKQARQFVTHGWVKVNGKKMIYPGYQLNPGDMFQVEPERVMFATGARKRRKGSPISEQSMIKDAEAAKEARAAKAQEEQENQDLDESDAGAATLESDEERHAMSTNPEDEVDGKKAMKNLITRAKRILEDSKRKLSGKRQQELRAFAQSVKKTLSKHGSGKGKDAETNEGADEVADFEMALMEIMTKIPDDAKQASTPDPQQNETPSNPQMRDPSKADAYAARKDAELLAAALTRARENPIDHRLPYASPWKPRDFMSAFAFIPRFLEVNQNICSAVYLRHPVARPGLAEVPTPFAAETMALAFNWYLRRR